MKTLGVIGGVGPLSTAYFMEVLINSTDAVVDQEHVDMIVLNHAKIPDRTAYILDNTMPNPVPMMVADAKQLEQMGANIIVTPCNTAHYFYYELAGAVNVRFINMIEETAKFLRDNGVKTVGVMATNGTIATRLFQDALEKLDITAVIPSPENQQYVMDIIYNNVKASRPIELDKFRAVTNELRLNGCERVILGCTELSVLKREYSLGDFYVDSLEVLVCESIKACGAKVKPRNP